MVKVRVAQYLRRGVEGKRWRWDMSVQSSIILISCFMFACANGMTQLNSIGFREYPLLGFIEFH